MLDRDPLYVPEDEPEAVPVRWAKAVLVFLGIGIVVVVASLVAW